MIKNILQTEMDIATLRWDMIKQFPHRAYFITESYDLCYHGILAFAQNAHGVITWGRFVDTGRSIMIRNVKVDTPRSKETGILIST